MTLPGFHTCVGCAGDGLDRSDDGWETGSPCELCAGAGQTPDQETIEAVGLAIERQLIDESLHGYLTGLPSGTAQDAARAALLAYAQHTQETKP